MEQESTNFFKIIKEALHNTTAKVAPSYSATPLYDRGTWVMCCRLLNL